MDPHPALFLFRHTLKSLSLLCVRCVYLAWNTHRHTLLSLTHTSIQHSYTHSLSHTHTYSHTISISPYLYRHSLSLSIFTYTHSLSLTHTYTNTHIYTHKFKVRACALIPLFTPLGNGRRSCLSCFLFRLLFFAARLELGWKFLGKNVTFLLYSVHQQTPLKMANVLLKNQFIYFLLLRPLSSGVKKDLKRLY